MYIERALGSKEAYLRRNPLKPLTALTLLWEICDVALEKHLNSQTDVSSKSYGVSMTIGCDCFVINPFGHTIFANLPTIAHRLLRLCLG